MPRWSGSLCSTTASTGLSLSGWSYATIEAARAGDVDQASRSPLASSRRWPAAPRPPPNVREQTGSTVGQIATASALMTETAGKIEEEAARLPASISSQQFHSIREEAANSCVVEGPLMTA